MAQKPIPLTNMQRSSLYELSGGSAIAMNVVSDKLGAVYKRPGLKTSDNLPGSVINASGLTSVHASYGGTVYATGPAYGVSDIYKLASGGVLNLSFDLATRLLGTSRPVLAETEALLVFVAGDDPRDRRQGAGLGRRDADHEHRVAHHEKVAEHPAAHLARRIALIPDLSP